MRLNRMQKNYSRMSHSSQWFVPKLLLLKPVNAPGIKAMVRNFVNVRPSRKNRYQLELRTKPANFQSPGNRVNQSARLYQIGFIIRKHNASWKHLSQVKVRLYYCSLKIVSNWNERGYTQDQCYHLRGDGAPLNFVLSLRQRMFQTCSRQRYHPGRSDL